MSFDQLAAVCRFATPDEDAGLAEVVAGRPVSGLQREARRRERLAEKDVAPRERRSVRWWWDEPARMLKLQGSLPAGDGALVVKALERVAEHQPDDPDRVGLTPLEQRHADALVRLASQSLGADTDPDRATVVVHVDAAALAGPAAVGETDGGLPVAAEVVRRLGCDARIETVIEHRGAAVGIGRASRRIPPWLSRQLGYRDRGCRFPGCETTRWVHAHHLVHWIDGGPTDLDNLATLCGYHHRLLHERGWKITGDPNHHLGWIRPDGTPYDPTTTRMQQMIHHAATARRAFTSTVRRE